MLEKLSRITQLIGLADNQQQVLDLIVTNVSQELNVEVCSVYLADYHLSQFVLMATRGLNQKHVGQLHIDFNAGLVGLVGRKEVSVHLQSAKTHPDFQLVDDINEEAFSAYLGVPIVHQRKVIGVLCIQQKEERHFELDEETFLITLAAQISSILSHSEIDAIINGEKQNQLVRCINGIPASNGVAVGVAMVVFPSLDLASVPNRKTDDIPTEIKKLNLAIKRTHIQLTHMSNRMKGLISDQELSLFDAYQQILSSAGLESEIENEIRKGFWAPYALRVIIGSHLKAFRSMEDPYLRERAQDIEDLANRVLGNLFKKDSLKTEPRENTILVAENITASLLAEIPLDNVVALVSLKGSSTSHAAILAKALGIPAVMGLDACQISRLDEKTIVVDAYNGQIYVSPDQSFIEHYQELVEEEQVLVKELDKERLKPNQTKDGTTIGLMVNSSHPIDFIKAQNSGADGIGLFRSEIAFMRQPQFPSERTQAQIYETILTGFEGLPVTIRTLDIGGDKQLPYFKFTDENPFLGWRGIRITLDHPEIFLVQLRAIFKASLGKQNLKIAIPMISTVQEIDESYRLINRAFSEIEEECSDANLVLYRPKIGIILEVPSAVFQLEHIAKRVDFISVGTNDLIQYLLAADRNNLKLKHLYSHFQPSVLRVLQQISDQCEKSKTDLHICGEMASDPLAAILLIGMGYRELSMSAGNLSKVKRTISRFTVTEMQNIAQRVVDYETSSKVKDELFKAMDERGLSGLLRAGG